MVPGDVILVKALHDYHDRRLLEIVDAVRCAFPEFTGRGLSLRVRLRGLGRVRIVDDEPITAL
jgi:hypothetical protein